ncbi:NADPH-dependent F420 reductase [Actinomadura latina]|uniref:NAD(P)-binding domain-containing protein n=1 Tax=Actinomadura latina TaxID=163603 RepID=A0A846ZAE3_9ACTN|nr:NAD(P)-binding domain-containing protein [Actinomadura latina]NKZ08707.1 NAD(P)-binding domain-containing protein [Actinomadura latina]
MRIAVLGTGEVGRGLATALVGAGHEVAVGSRTADNARAVEWAREHGGRHGDFAGVCRDAEVVVNATNGAASLEALGAAGDLAGRVVVDVANPLDFSAGFPPAVMAPGGLSLAERIQEALPGARVVKTLNTMTSAVMVRPSSVPGEHVVFVSGDDEGAKKVAAELLGGLGWPGERIVDLGPLSTARAVEQLVSLWLVLFGRLGTPSFNFGVHR